MRALFRAAQLVCAAAPLVYAGCMTTSISLGAAVPVTDTPPATIPLEIVTRSSAPDPLPLEGKRRNYSDVEVSLGHAVSTAVVPWADAHRDTAPLQLVVELASARAQSSGGVIAVALNVRAMLRQREGNVYLGQTQAHCKARGSARPDEAAPIFYHCMMSVGRELAGWLGGIQP
jgi:hypothetical protein